MTSFGFGGGGGFGSSQSSPFGGSTFGSSQPAFGQQGSSPFGASSPGLFGASTPAFGAAQTPAFGASSSAFGSSTFGAKPSTGFGTFGSPSSSPAFGAQPAFGASSSAFGAPQSTPAFGAQPFGSATPAAPFGGGSNAFGASSTPAFGGGMFNNSGFGSSGFNTGASFGQQTPQQQGFGMQQQQQGTKHLQYQKVPDTEGTGTTKTTVGMCTIAALPGFRPPNDKSFAELRWEDYQMGVKGNTGQQTASFGQQTPNAFGTPQTPGFAFQSTPAFGQSQAAFGQSSSPSFGFGQSSSAFGASSSVFGKSTGSSIFGQASTPAFGGASSSAPFGSTGFGQTSSSFSTPNPFGQSTPGFGQTGFGASFGASTPSFSTPSSNPFGGTPSPQPFGQAAPSTGGFSFNQPASSSPFSFSNSLSTFGQSSAAASFGQQASSSMFSFSQSTGASAFGTGGGLFNQSKPFGASSPSLFGQTTGGSLFGGTGGGFSFQTGGLMGTQQSQAGNLFSFSQPSMLGGQPAQQGLMQLPGVGSSPYGTLPAAPQVGAAALNVPEYRVGISQRPTGLMAKRPMALISTRNINNPASVTNRPSVPRSRSARRYPSSSVDALTETETQSQSSPISSPSIFVRRDNVNKFFIRESLPSTESSPLPSRSPSLNVVGRDSGGDQAASKGGREKPATNGTPNGKAKQVQASVSPKPSSSQGKAATGQRLSFNREEDSKSLEEDQAGPSMPERAAARHLSDEEISQILPSISDRNIYIEPSLTQLAAMAREDPGSLEAVSNFKIGHKKHGYVVWLEPVNVWGLEIEDLVAFLPGSIDVYLDETKKPPIGEGLNKPAEIALSGVFRIDKATGKPTTDPAAISKYTQKLKAKAASQGARFVDYNADKGVWRFRVDHFSRYGLINESDSDEEAMTSEQQIQGIDPVSGLPVFQFPPLEEDGMQEGDEVMGPLSETLEPEGLGAGLSPSNQRIAASPDLIISLPASRNLQPADLESMRQAVFPSSARSRSSDQAMGRRHPGKGLGPQEKEAPQRLSRRRGAEGFEQPSRQDNLRPRLDNNQQDLLVPGRGQPAQERDKRVTNRVWVNPSSALDLAQPCQSPGEDLTMRAVSETALRCGLDETSQKVDSGTHKQLLEAGAFMGRSCRVGWGPGNSRFSVVPAASATAGEGGPQPFAVCGQELKLTSAVARPSSKEAQRSYWLQLLQQHRQTSSQESTSDQNLSTGSPWALHCSRTEELSALCAAFAEIHANHAAESGNADLDRVCAGHQVQIWKLVDMLYSDFPQETARNLEDAMEESAEEGFVKKEDGGDHVSKLTAAKRRASVSDWLRGQCLGPIKKLVGQGKGVLHDVAQLLSGHRVCEAATLAASGGNPRLAMSIIQAASSLRARKDIAAQLDVWEGSNLSGGMEPLLLDVYRLLSGEPERVIAELKLDWRRSLGLYLWFGGSANTPLAATLEQYMSSMRDATAPKPVPPYVEGHGWKPGQRRKSDLSFSLLQLFVGHMTDELSADVEDLTTPECHTPEPLDALFSWLLLQTLLAIGAVRRTAAVLEQGTILTTDVVSQLHSIGGMEEWEVYVAMHLPDLPEAPHSREQLVRALLMRGAPLWQGQENKQDFLKGLGFPWAWFLEAMAIHARATGDKTGELESLLASGSWPEAHKVLVNSLAASLFLGTPEDVAQLRRTVGILEGHQVEIDEAVGAGSFRSGAGLYLAYFSLLQEAEENSEALEERTEAVESLFQDLSQATASAGVDEDLDFLQAMSKMADDASRWLHGAEADLSTSLLSLQLKPLPSESRRNLLHDTISSISEALLA